MRISSVKPVPWLAVNRHHLFSDGAAFNTQREFTDKLRNIAFIIEGDSSAITNVVCPSLLVNSLCVLTAAPSENRKQVVGGGGLRRILNIFLYDINYMNINIFKIYAVCVCNKYAQHTHTYIM